jgi:hypothetical protein
MWRLKRLFLFMPEREAGVLRLRMADWWVWSGRMAAMLMRLWSSMAMCRYS